MPPDGPRAAAAWTVTILVFAVILVWAAYLVRQTLLLIYVSALLAIGFSPVVRAIEHQRIVAVGSRRLPRWLAILGIYLVVLGTLTGIGFMVFPPFVTQAREFAGHLPQLLRQAQQILVRRGILPEPLTVGELVQQAPAPTDVVGAVILGFWGVVGGIFGLVTILILTFYLLVETDDIFAAFVRLFPPGRRTQVRDLSRQITTKVSAWLVGQLMLGAIIGGTTAIVLGLLGVPYFYVLAVIAGIGELIPYVGPVLAAIPAIAVAAISSWQLAVGVAVFFFLQQQLENHLLVPKVMGHQVGLSAAGVIIALLLGGSLLGIPGAILAVPTAAILQVLFQELVASEQ
jgi:predicted PurR-regulated permease PerM